ncbi:hypothetical protein [Paracoccus alkanivorans]|uniref:Uncharacterized protein n=1 Tax=Paracoccus alkanivorans TaxID=2116655 RepID=A0A3M0MJF0_9RHOB|nr:hypothetical protein [Paracoccus alkanivorans]RMC37575.1 hypothetical protein C9E81_02150 [Paracoccus alkanivorans]
MVDMLDHGLSQLSWIPPLPPSHHEHHRRHPEYPAADHCGLCHLLIFGALAWFFRRLPEHWRIDIEANHSEALHRALHSGAELLIDTLQKHPAVAIPDRAIGEIVDYVRMSVPAAIRRPGPLQERMARAKLRERLDAITGRDRLSKTLERAGAM